MELTTIYTIVGFALAGYSVIANDSIQTHITLTPKYTRIHTHKSLCPSTRHDPTGQHPNRNPNPAHTRGLVVLALHPLTQHQW